LGSRQSTRELLHSEAALRTVAAAATPLEHVKDAPAALPGLRERVVLSARCFGNLDPGDRNAGGARRNALIARLEESLRHLQTDYVDLYWPHKFTLSTTSP
jgi:aryl-alcohol dehydrogenase-like predicted oxidoreductase